MFRDKEGKLSSKRITGTIVVAVVLVIAILGTVRDSAVTAELLWPLITLGGGLLGVSVAERRK